jgi:hypothetical protein
LESLLANNPRFPKIHEVQINTLTGLAATHIQHTYFGV